MRHRLNELHSTLRQHLAGSDGNRTRLLADRVRNLDDGSVTDLLIDADLAEVDREIAYVRDIEAAFARIRATTYGICVKCNGLIPYERLSVQPAANRCRDCQSVFEKTHAGISVSAL